MGPPSRFTLEAATDFTRQLAAALRWLDARVIPMKGMADVVARLRTEDAGVRDELEQLELALREMCSNLWKAKQAASRLCKDLDRFTNSSSIGDRADAPRMALEQLVIGLGAMHREVRGWGLAGAHPNSDG